MEKEIDRRLAGLGVKLPTAVAPAGNYVAFSRSGNLLMTSAQLPLRDGKITETGRLGRELSVAQGQEAARYCAVNILAQAKTTLGRLADIRRMVRITVFVASAPEFDEHHLVANGASDFLVAVLGDIGRHARSTVGVSSLPLGAPVAIDAVIEIA